MTLPDRNTVDNKPRERDRLVREPMAVFDRVRFALFVVSVALMVAFARTEANPLIGWGEALYGSFVADRWLLWVLGAELVRQVSFLIAEHNSSYHRFWRDTVFGWWHARLERFDPWSLHRLRRVWRVVVVLAVVGTGLGIVSNESPLTALLSIPSTAWGRLPMVLQWAVYLLLSVGQFVALFWFLSRGGVETYMPNEIQTRFSDVWGQDHVLEKVRENLVFLEQPELVERVGGYVPSGILLWGPPGTGKTLIAEAVAGETGKPYVFVDPGAFQAMFVGVGIMKVKALFRKLRKLSLRYGGVIVFFDEADSLGNRGQLAAGGFRGSGAQVRFLDEHDRWLTASTRGALEQGKLDQMVMHPGGGGGGGMGTLQALLAEMQGLKKPAKGFFRAVRKLLGMRPKLPPTYRIMYVMATNMPDSLDAALLRPGRIDRIYKVGYPTKEGRRRTYEGYLAKVPHALDADQIDQLASMTPPRTGAEIKDMVNEALIHSMKHGRGRVEWADILHARYIRQTGLPEGFVYVEWERHAVAIHEACHAVAAAVLRPWYPIDVATIERRGDVGGFVSSFDSDEQFAKWRNDFEADICVSLASLAGEKLFFGGDNSAGVSGDLQNATRTAYTMLGLLGMGATIASLSGRPGEWIGGITDVGGEHLDRHVEAKLRELYDKVEHLLGSRRLDVLAVAHALETHKTITGADIEGILRRSGGENVEGSAYADTAFLQALERYHASASAAHWAHDPVGVPLPTLDTSGPCDWVVLADGVEGAGETFAYGADAVDDGVYEGSAPVVGLGDADSVQGVDEAAGDVAPEGTATKNGGVGTDGTQQWPQWWTENNGGAT